MPALRSRYSTVILAAMLCLALAAGVATTLATSPRHPAAGVMLDAARRTVEVTAVIRSAREARGIPIDPAADPNRTGLLGVEWSPITTTLGHLSAKRTSTNPNIAAGLVLWMTTAGVDQGSVVAVGASGSFPGLVVATLAAARALGAEPVVITSVAASSWGANIPAFTWLDMEEAMVEMGVGVRSAGASLGGEADSAIDLTLDGRARLAAAIARSGVPPVPGQTLRERVRARMAIYDRAAAGRPIAVFVNVGGAAANVGTCTGILEMRPGVHGVLPACRGEPGVLWRMIDRGVPAIHLLHVDGVAAAFDLPLDPVPLPIPGRGAPFTRPSRGVSLALLAALSAGLALIVRGGRGRDRHPRAPTHQAGA